MNPTTSKWGEGCYDMGYPFFSTASYLTPEQVHNLSIISSSFSHSIRANTTHQFQVCTRLMEAPLKLFLNCISYTLTYT